MKSYPALDTAFVTSSEARLKWLYERYAGKLTRYAQRKWKLDEDVAWDLFYQTIYKVNEVEGQYHFGNEAKFDAFVFSIFLNRIRDYLRSAKGRAERNSGVELKDEMLGSGGEQAMIERENPSIRILQEELDLLEDWERILVLMRSQDIAYSEIAQYVDKPEKHLKIYYARIRKRLIDRVQHTITQGFHDKKRS